MKCFYHNDLDGKCAAFWVKHFFPKSELIEIHHYMFFPFDTINKDEEIWFVDFCITPEEMLKLLDITQDVTVIDHHITKIDAYKNFPHKLKGIMKSGYAGCVLTNMYLNKATFKDENIEKEFLNVPYFTRLIGDRDIWAFQYGDDTKYFNLGLLGLDNSPESLIWYYLFLDEEIPIKNLIKKGKIIEGFKKYWAKDYIQLCAFETDFEGYKCVAMNLGQCGSEYFDAIKEDYDILIAFAFDGLKWIISFYSQKVDVSVIAKKYNGGGHKGAAGCSTKELPFSFKKKIVINSTTSLNPQPVFSSLEEYVNSQKFDMKDLSSLPTCRKDLFLERGI